MPNIFYGSKKMPRSSEKKELQTNLKEIPPTILQIMK